MLYFRARDYLSVLCWRLLLAPFFGAFGRGVRVVYPLRIVGARYVHFADRVTLQYGAYLAVLPSQEQVPLLAVGAWTMIGNHAHIICTRRVDIGEKVLIADRVYIADNRHGYLDIGRPVLEQPLKQLGEVRIGAGSWIGENVCIIGASIGRQCVIGANSVVTRDIPDYCVAAGSPAVPIKRYFPARGQWLKTDRAGEPVE